jgi:hypothetical protein
LPCDHVPDAVAFGGQGKVLAAWDHNEHGDCSPAVWDFVPRDAAP